MYKAVINTASIIYISFILMFAGCATVQAPPAPSELKYETDKTSKILEAQVVADKIAGQKQTQKKPLVKSKDKPAPADPAWASIRKQHLDIRKPLALADLIDTALSNNPNTRGSWENTRLAIAEHKQAQSELYPQINFSADVTRERTIANQPISSFNDLHVGPTLQITYLLLDFGGRGARIEEAAQRINSANAQYNQSLQDLILNVEKAYYNLYSSKSNLEAALDDVKNTKADFQASQDRLSAGLAVKLDVLQAQSDYEDALYSLEDAKGQVQTAQGELARLLGYPADTKFEIAMPTKELPTNVTEIEVSEFIDEAIKRRPDIASMRAELSAKKAAVKAAASDLWPTLDLGGSVDTNRYKYYGNKKSQPYDYGWEGYGAINWDVFDGFYNFYKRRAAQREVDMGYQKLIDAELAASADVWIRYYDFNTAVQKLKFSESFLETSRNSYALALESYKAGLKDILDLLRSQSKLSQARSRYIQSKEDCFVTLAELAHSTGSLTTKKK